MEITGRQTRVHIDAEDYREKANGLVAGLTKMTVCSNIGASDNRGAAQTNNLYTIFDIDSLPLCPSLCPRGSEMTPKDPE